MALAHPEPLGEPVSDEEFVAAVRRNVKALLAMNTMEQQDLAPLVGLSPAVLSSRMTTGKSRTSWRDAELLNVARALDVSLDVVIALSDQEFREALSRSRCSSNLGWPRHLTVVPDPEPEIEQGQLDLDDT